MEAILPDSSALNLFSLFMEDDVSSWRHHYLPEFYLKGFTNAGNSLLVYDKKYNRISTKGPGGIFFEPHRNTGILVHPETAEVHKSDLAEHLLADFDREMAIALDKIRSSSPEDNIISIDLLLYEVRMLTQSIFWRSPANDALLNKVIDEFSFEDLGFGIFDDKGNPYVEWEERFKAIDLWRKFYPAFLMLASFKYKYAKRNDDRWKLYYLPDDYHITSDNPLVLFDYQDLSSLQQELLFPVLKNILLVSTKKHPPPILPNLFSAKLDLLIFDQASRFVAGPNEGYLKFLVQEVNRHSKRTRGYEQLKEDVFSYFY
jgi:hypothetical protein